MATTPSLQMLLAAYAESTGRQVIGLLTVNPAGPIDAVRYCTGNAPVTSRGDLFSPLAFDVRLPSVEGGAIKPGELVIDNTGDEPIATLRTATTTIRVKFEIVLGNTATDTAAINRVEMSSEWQIVPGLSYTPTEIRARLGYDTVLSDSYPSRTFAPGDFAALF
jgi:hypothetical protein